MPNLSDVLSLINFTTKDQQLSYVRYLAYRNCFSKPILLTDEKLEQKTPRHVRIEQALASWEKSQFKESYLHHTNRIIDESEAKELLKVEFETLKDGYEWLLYSTQVNFLRDSFDLEGLGMHKERTGINLSRYNPKDEVHVIDLEEKTDKASDLYQLYQCAKHLKLIDEVPIPLDKDIEYFIIHACVEKFAKDRAFFLETVFQKLEKNPSQSIKIYYTTNPRGLFNDEESLAGLLAEQFGLPDKVDIIRAILKKHKDSKDDKTWTRDLSGLKKEILEALGVDKWPEAPHSYYYKHPERYEARSKLEGRESLKDWPTAGDMFSYYLRQLALKYPHAKYELFEVIGDGQNGKIANTKDLTEAWVRAVGENIPPPDFLVFVSSNSMHQTENQRIIAEPIIKKLKGIEFICAGPGGTKFSLATSLDVLTKTLYEIYPAVLKKIDDLSQEKQEAKIVSNPALLNAKPTSLVPDVKQEAVKTQSNYSSLKKYGFGISALAVGLFTVYKIFSGDSSNTITSEINTQKLKIN